MGENAFTGLVERPLCGGRYREVVKGCGGEYFYGLAERLLRGTAGSEGEGGDCFYRPCTAAAAWGCRK